jgi:hypothetical protein
MREDNPFDAAFDRLRERNAHVTKNLTSEWNVQLYWIIAHYWFIAGANTFQNELISDEALRNPLTLLAAVAEVQDKLNTATSSLFMEIEPLDRSRRH